MYNPKPPPQLSSSGRAVGPGQRAIQVGYGRGEGGGGGNGNDDLLRVVDYMRTEFEAIAAAFQDMDALELRPIHVEPKKPREGMSVFADGTDWDPGSGKGYYVYNGGLWVFLG